MIKWKVVHAVIKGKVVHPVSSFLSPQLSHCCWCCLLLLLIIRVPLCSYGAGDNDVVLLLLLINMYVGVPSRGLQK